MVGAGLSVIVPAYDEAGHLAANLRRLSTCLEGAGRSFEILVVDDGSRDGTGEAARCVAAEDPRVRVFAHASNLGKGHALATGCAEARQDILVLLDADLEIPPEDVLPLVERMERTGADLAVGSKYHPEASLQWPLARRALSRLYHAVTAMLFRLPLRDTQTGLKALRRCVADALLPRLRCRRFAWDLELVLLAHRSGYQFVTGPVHVRPADRASRVGPAGALQAGLDTLLIFLRDRTLGHYGPRRGARPRPTRVLVSGDDLGMSPSVNEGLLRGLECDGIRSVSVLAAQATLAEAAAGLARRAPGADVGLHLDLLDGRSGPGFAWRSLIQTLRGCDAGAVVGAQLRALRGAGLVPTHVDAHRHAWCLPWIRRRVCRRVGAAGVPAVRSLRPLGPLLGAGWIEAAKRLVFLAGASLSAGTARQYGLAVPEGFIDAAAAARWVAAGRVPGWARGRTVEVVCHPALGVDDVPRGERGNLDRGAEARAVLEPPLAAALAALGVEVLDFRRLADSGVRRED